MLPPSPVDWFLENYLVLFLLEVGAERDLGEIQAWYHQKVPRGEKAYDPRMMLVLLLCAYWLKESASARSEAELT